MAIYDKPFRMDNEKQQIGIAFERALIHVGRFVR